MNSHLLIQRAKAFDYLFDSIVVTDFNGTISDWNKGSETLYGYTKEEAIGQCVSILHVPEDSERIISEVLASVEQHGKWTGEIRMLRKNGEIGWIESMCVPMFDDNNQMIGALGINRDITERMIANERLLIQAHFDNLTKIPNRYLLLDRLHHLIQQSERNKNIFALLFIDIDNLKKINDSKGHTFGDSIIKETAYRLQQCIRTSDTVARIGGDEFIILLENISNKEDVSAIIHTLKAAFHIPMLVDNENYEVSCSIGASFYPDDGTTTDALLSASDLDMYRSKKYFTLRTFKNKSIKLIHF